MIRSLLAPLGIAFDQAARIRSRLYEKNIFERVQLSKPVVSVGNLTVGGTGKTPVVDAVLTQFENRNLKCAVLTRGYGRESMAPVVINRDSTTSEVGDEPLWLYKRHPDAQIAVGADRVRSSLNLNPDIFILDDGFQHRRIQRNVDVVLIDCSRPLWHYHPLPWGYAREDLSSLARAQLIVLTRVNQAKSDTLKAMRLETQKYPQVICVESSLLFAGCRALLTDEPTEVRLKKVFAYAAIGNPESFRLTLGEAGAIVVGEEWASDHAPVDAAKMGHLMAVAEKSGADYLLLTEKDAVKWRELVTPDTKLATVPILVVLTRLKFEPPLPDIYDLSNHLSR